MANTEAKAVLKKRKRYKNWHLPIGNRSKYSMETVGREVHVKIKVGLLLDSLCSGLWNPNGIICVEDLIHEILTVRPRFKEANNSLWPFQLKTPLRGMKEKTPETASASSTSSLRE
ncbi:unnamed protein product [Cochlearia groenlandica]